MMKAIEFTALFHWHKTLGHKVVLYNLRKELPKDYIAYKNGCDILQIKPAPESVFNRSMAQLPDIQSELDDVAISGQETLNGQ